MTTNKTTRPVARQAVSPQAGADTIDEAPPVAREPARPIVPGRAVALNRAGKPIQRVAAETGVNEFHIPPHLPPPGWSWEWKEETVLGEVRQGYAAKLASVGWEPVMMESYPGVFAPEYNDRGELNRGPVRRGGLMLQERGMELTKEAMRDEKRRADEKVGNAKTQYSRLNTSGAPTAEIDSAAQQSSYIRQRTETVATPTDPNGRIPIE